MFAHQLYICVCASKPDYFLTLRIPTGKKVKLCLQLLASFATPPYISEITAKIRIILKTKMKKLWPRFHSFFSIITTILAYTYVFFFSSQNESKDYIYPPE